MAAVYRGGAIRERSRRVHARHVLGDAAVRIDTEHLLNKLVLTQIDVCDGNRRQEGLKDGSGARVVAGKEGLAAQTQVLADVGRVGVSHDSRCVSERLRVIDDSLRWSVGAPTGAALHRTGHECIADRRSRVGVEFVQHAAHERAQLRRGHRLERAAEVRVLRGNARSPTATSSSHGILPELRRTAAAAECRLRVTSVASPGRREPGDRGPLPALK